ncbi:MAG: hypothetical protein P5702_07535 [Limnospira sp. PMC 1291.21]|uniref:Uncharacterized protein n=2 Tax=Limnospira TaxID=2596745 RepID=A0ABU9ERW1_LIMFS|nr:MULTISPECIES: hypothetical protein [Limnospira]AMW31309.1 hypothetical protein AP285_28695 [Arthrospira platensis YZ]EKD10189.1 hypothetical protein SPLC1_S102190 [Arthrospira platensis C1]MBD2667894.1 hypothetical protein [Arthrospira platensis FACHB-439]MDC0836631.1 hypothetical protein [Limnoraphis robusta]MDT9181304.1 hypothetical protein [Limnospira sp. PMC 289.06]MDY7053079.1 hypothetical protein [Limnospira fusiformis LS22]QJB28610.1 hypothetical protein HFV01_25880 [Limnospira fus
MSVQLVPLHIPSGWAILHNSFGDVDPVIEHGYIINGEFFNENLLSAKPIEFNGTDWVTVGDGYLLQLGWYPEYRPEGCYRLTVSQGSGDQKIVVKYESKEREEIRQVLQRCLGWVSRRVGIDEIGSLLEIEGKQIDKNPLGFRGVRKKIVGISGDKLNRSTYSQVGWWSPVYYEVCNMAYLDQKSNRIDSNGLTPENKMA